MSVLKPETMKRRRVWKSTVILRQIIPSPYCSIVWFERKQMLNARGF